jgi:hypothetical protein
MNNSDKILRGDLNARSDSEPDFIQNNSYGDYECDIIQEKRNSYDNKLDTRGKQLIGVH